MSSLELTALVTAAANSIAMGLGQNEIALIASIFVQIGDTLATISAQRAVNEAKKPVSIEQRRAHDEG